MHCRSCGADLPVDAAFCSQCGARVELGSVLGVGTDLPAMPRRDQPIAEPEHRPEPGQREPEARPEPTEDLSQTRELPRVDPTAAPPAGVAHEATEPMTRAPAPVPAASPRPQPGRHEAPAAPVPAPVAHHEPVAPHGHDAHDVHDDRPGHSRNSILAMIVTFAVLTIIGTFALTRLVGSDDPQPTTASSSSASGAEETGDASEAPSPSGSAAQGGSPSASASSSVPAGARRCSTSGSDSVATAYAGSERTSCEFAGAVREAYRKAGTPEGATSLRAYSPVTKKWYSLSCDGGEPVRCTSTTNAIVLLAP